MRSSGLSSILGIALEKERIAAIRLHRTNGSLHVRESLEAPLSLDLITRDPLRLGREIRSHLDSAGIQERRCVVCIPLAWAYMLQTEVPPLSDRDAESFLKVQGERAFPFPPEELTLAVSRDGTSERAGRAMLAAVPSSRLAALRQALQAAGLLPLSITFGVTSLAKKGQGAGQGTLVLLAGDSGVDLAITLGDIVLALRTLEEAGEADAGPLDGARIARQIRMTLGQFPEDLREKIDRVSLFGPPERTEPLHNALRGFLEPLGMSVDFGKLVPEIPGVEPGAHEFHPALLSATTGPLLGQSPAFEFLRVPASRLKQLLGRVSSRSTLWLGGAAAALLLGLGAALLVQYVWLAHLQSEWNRIEPKVAELKILQEKVRRVRPWFNDSLPSLVITRTLTEAFPESGSVWLKRLELKEPSEVSCSGHARSNLEWLAMLDRLRATPGVEDLQVLQVRGADPLQFTLSFRWEAGARDEP